MQLIGETTNRSNPLPIPVEMRAPFYGRSLRNAPSLGTHATANLGTRVGGGLGSAKKQRRSRFGLVSQCARSSCQTSTQISSYLARAPGNSRLCTVSRAREQTGKSSSISFAAMVVPIRAKNWTLSGCALKLSKPLYHCRRCRRHGGQRTLGLVS